MRSIKIKSFHLGIKSGLESNRVIELLDNNINQLRKTLDSEPLNSVCIALGIVFWAMLCVYAGLNY
jgi:hypothetical protein